MFQWDVSCVLKLCHVADQLAAKLTWRKIPTQGLGNKPCWTKFLCFGEAILAPLAQDKVGVDSVSGDGVDKVSGVDCVFVVNCVFGVDVNFVVCVAVIFIWQRWKLMAFSFVTRCAFSCCHWSQVLRALTTSVPWFVESVAQKIDQSWWVANMVSNCCYDSEHISKDVSDSLNLFLFLMVNLSGIHKMSLVCFHL